MSARFVIAACAVATFLFVGLPALHAVNTSADAPADAPIAYQWKGKDMYEAPVFSHTDHAVVEDCTTCHHTWDGSSPIKKCGSADCHPVADFKVKKGTESLYMAFHDRKSIHSCIGCHKQMKQGPTRCTDCHARKK